MKLHRNYTEMTTSTLEQGRLKQTNFTQIICFKGFNDHDRDLPQQEMAKMEAFFRTSPIKNYQN